MGESFAAIFEGNCLVLGIAAVCVGEAQMRELMGVVEENPSTRFELDVASKEISFKQQGISRKIPVLVSGSAQKALTSGLWDQTGMLVDNLEKVREKAKQIPYVNWSRQ